MVLRSRFVEYLNPTKEHLSDWWSNAILAFDTSILLNLYECSVTTRNEVFATMARLQDRLWLPHQAALEYHKRRQQVINEEIRRFTKVESDLEKMIAQLGQSNRAEITQPHIDEVFTEVTERAREELSKVRSVDFEDLEQDRILTRLVELFADNVGEPLSGPGLEQLYVDGKERYTKRVPPGWKDDGKREPDRYGDLILWREMLLHTKQQQRPLFFITDDTKDDWWLKSESMVLGPLPALRRECLTFTGQPYHCYTLSHFFEDAAWALELEAQQKAIEELREIERRESERQRRAEAARILRQAGRDSSSRKGVTAITKYLDAVRDQQAALYRQLGAVQIPAIEIPSVSPILSPAFLRSLEVLHNPLTTLGGQVEDGEDEGNEDTIVQIDEEDVTE